VRVESTSFGIRISAGNIRRENVLVEHFSLSSCGEPLSRAAAGVLAQLLLRLRSGAAYELIAGGHGVFHVLVPAGQKRGRT
jgi:hypothetical protein